MVQGPELMTKAIFSFITLVVYVLNPGLEPYPSAGFLLPGSSFKIFAGIASLRPQHKLSSQSRCS